MLTAIAVVFTLWLFRIGYLGLLIWTEGLHVLLEDTLKPERVVYHLIIGLLIGEEGRARSKVLRERMRRERGE